jgi:hypothetical protein
MTWRNTLIVSLLICVSGAARAAGTLDINVNNIVAEASWSSPVGNGQLSFGGLYNDLSHNWLLHAGFLGRGEGSTSMGRTTAGIGGRAYGGPVGDKNDALLLALGGEFTLFPSNGNIGFGGYAYYAPNVLSLRDVNRFWDAGVRVEFEVIKRTGYAYIGYRYMSARLDTGGDVGIDHSGMVGLRIGF